MTIYGAIEAGGTKFVCAVGDAQRGSLQQAVIKTRDPGSTFADVATFFRKAQHRHGRLTGMGIGSFGPIGLDPASPSYGHILRTSKPGWEGCDIIGQMADIVDCPIAIDTDVNAAALAELAAAAGHVSDLAYVTVGTGIGVGLIANGDPIHGTGHPEVGHILPRRHPAHGDFAGVCPFHGDCLEGLASGPAIAKCWGIDPATIPDAHPFWGIQADYLAQLSMTLLLGAAPSRIVFGGGVMQQQRLLPLIRKRTVELLAGYLDTAAQTEQMRSILVSPSCREASGLTGAFILAARAARGEPVKERVRLSA